MRYLAAWILLTLVTVAGVVLFLDEPLILWALAVALVIFVAMSMDQRLVIPIVVLLLPLEIGARLIPILETQGTDATNLGTSALNPARVGILVGVALWTVKAPRDWWEELPRSSLYLPAMLLVGLYILSLGNTTNVRGAAEEVGRLLIHLLLFFLIAVHVRDRQVLRWTILALVGTGLALALVGLFQQATDTYLWNEDLRSRAEGIVRRNATFVDSNIYARFLVISMVMALAMFFQEKMRLRYLLLTAFACAGLALPFTSSRSNWVAAAVVLPLVVLALPIGGRSKLRMLVLGSAGAIGLALVATAIEPDLAGRFRTLASGADAAGVRSYLIRAGWQMFLDHPIFGVGLDGYKDALEGPYNRFVSGSIVRSHTSMITVMAELGLLGLIVLSLLAYRFVRLGWRVYGAGRSSDRAWVVGLGGVALAIFVSSQTEGRLFEEPYLWLVLGLMVALAGMQDREGGRLPRPPDHEPPG
jgi:putative inorganic carbon (HCO3(-)) transporter